MRPSAAGHHVVAGIVGILLEAVDIGRFRLEMGTDARRRNDSAEEEQIDVAAARDVELRADRKVQVHLRHGDPGPEILHLVGAEVDAGAVAEVVGHALGVFKTDLDADGIGHVHGLPEMDAGGRTGAEADLGRSVRARERHRRGRKEEQQGLFHGHRCSKVLQFNDFCGGGGIRTPGTLPYNSFQDCRHRPLGHASSVFQSSFEKNFHWNRIR